MKLKQGVPAGLKKTWIAVLSVMIAAAVFAGCSGKKAGSPAPAPEPVAAAPVEAPAAEPEGAEASKQSTVNILIAGLDKYGKPDALMVAAVSKKNRTISIISIPRDTRLEVGGSPRKVRYFSKVKDELQGAVSNMLGVEVGYYVTLDLASAEKAIDAVGGIDVEVERDMQYKDTAQGLSIDINKGRQRLNGANAVKYARYKDGSGGESGRVSRQQRAASAFVARLVSPDIVQKFPGLIKTLIEKPVVRTNLTVAEAMDIIGAFGADFTGATSVSTLPGDMKYIRGAGWVIPDEKKIKELASTVFAE